MTLKELLGDNYKDGMTLEDVTAALTGMTMTPDQNEVNRLKAAVSKANGEAAQFKRERDALKNNNDQTNNDWQAKYDELKKRLDESERERSISKHVSSLLEIGYDADLASKTATAIVDGDMVTMLANQKAFLTAHDKKVLEDNMRGTPRPGAGGGTGGAVDWNKAINDAMNSGDMARAAALMRQQQESSAANK